MVRQVIVLYIIEVMGRFIIIAMNKVISVPIVRSRRNQSQEGKSLL